VDSYGEAGGGGAAGVNQSMEEILDAAKIYEDTNNFSRAIDAYLSITETSSAEPDQLEEVWENAVRLAMKHAPDRSAEVVGTVAKRLKGISRFEAAADLYESIDNPREAVNCLIAGEHWEKARRTAQEQAPDLVRVVEERYKSHLVSSGDGEELIRKTGDINSALDMYARQGDWTKCLALAAKESPKMLPHYLVQYCKILANKGEILQACQSLVQYGPPSEESNFQLYKVITQELLASEEEGAATTLREMLLRLVGQAPGAVPPTPKALMDDGRPQAREFGKAVLSAHLQTCRNLLKAQNKSPELIAKISIALCRYCTEFPVDNAFYDAGLDCKHANMINMSFFFLNRFLDISDAIEDPDNAAIDNTDFLETDIPSPYDLDLPEETCIDSKQVEEIRDVVLGWSMDASVQQKMDTRQCDKCRADIYVASMACPHCGEKYEPCVVSGYPVSKRTRVECSGCKSPANRDDWNFWMQQYKACPWCKSPQNAVYTAQF